MWAVIRRVEANCGNRRFSPPVRNDQLPNLDVKTKARIARIAALRPSGEPDKEFRRKMLRDHGEFVCDLYYRRLIPVTQAATLLSMSEITFDRTYRSWQTGTFHHCVSGGAAGERALHLELFRRCARDRPKDQPIAVFIREFQRKYDIQISFTGAYRLIANLDKAPVEHHRHCGDILIPLTDMERRRFDAIRQLDWPETKAQQDDRRRHILAEHASFLFELVYSYKIYAFELHPVLRLDQPRLTEVLELFREGNLHLFLIEETDELRAQRDELFIREYHRRGLSEGVPALLAAIRRTHNVYIPRSRVHRLLNKMGVPRNRRVSDGARIEGTVALTSEEKSHLKRVQSRRSSRDVGNLLAILKEDGELLMKLLATRKIDQKTLADLLKISLGQVADIRRDWLVGHMKRHLACPPRGDEYKRQTQIVENEVLETQRLRPVQFVDHVTRKGVMLSHNQINRIRKRKLGRLQGIGSYAAH
jgi:hypothetical protein